VQRMLTDMNPTQQRLAEVFNIHQYAPTRRPTSLLNR
jgi:hypothetical protein